jgi:hypothetical protein
MSAQYHGVRFFDSPRALAQIVAEFLHEGLAGGSAAIVVAEPILREAIVRALTLRSLDVVELERANKLRLLDARATLSRFMVNGKPDPRKFTDAMCETIRLMSPADGASSLRIFGQMVDVLWQDGLKSEAIVLERLWNQFAQTEAFSLLCGYALGDFYKDAHFADIYAQHSHVVAEDGRSMPVAETAASIGIAGSTSKPG